MPSGSRISTPELRALALVSGVAVATGLLVFLVTTAAIAPPLDVLLSPGMPRFGMAARNISLGTAALAAALFGLATWRLGLRGLLARLAAAEQTTLALLLAVSGLCALALASSAGLPVAIAGAGTLFVVLVALVLSLLEVKVQPLPESFTGPKLGVAISLLGFATYTLFGWLRHRHFYSHSMDFGSYVQTFWLYSRFETPINTVLDGDHALGDHFALILMPLAQLSHLFGTAGAMIVTQAGIVSSGAYPIFRLAERKTGSRAAGAAFAFSYLLAMAVQNAFNLDFHALGCAAGVIAWLLYATFYGRDWQLVLAGFALLATKEHVASYVAAIGVFAFLFEKRRVPGGILAVAGTLWFVIIPTFVMPTFPRPTRAEAVPHFTFAALGPNMEAALVHVVSHPLQSLLLLVDHHGKVESILISVGAVLLLPLLRPRWFVVALPMLGERFWSTEVARWGQAYYAIPLSVMSVAAAIDALPTATALLQRVLVVVGSKVDAVRAARWLPAACVAATILMALFARRPAAALFDPASGGWAAQPRQAVYEALVAAVDKDPNVSVAAQDAVLPHVAERHRVYQLETGLEQGADVVVLDLLGNTWPYDRPAYQRLACTAFADRVPVFVKETGVVLAHPRPGRQAVALSPELQRFTTGCSRLISEK